MTRNALDQQDVDLVLPYVQAPGEAEVRDAFDLAVKARTQGAEAREVADRFFFETVVHVHRAGEGAAYTGLKPAGLDVGPVIPLAERAIATGDPARSLRSSRKPSTRRSKLSWPRSSTSSSTAARE